MAKSSAGRRVLPGGTWKMGRRWGTPDRYVPYFQFISADWALGIDDRSHYAGEVVGVMIPLSIAVA
jgi:hypothetical protein